MSKIQLIISYQYGIKNQLLTLAVSFLIYCILQKAFSILSIYLRKRHTIYRKRHYYNYIKNSFRLLSAPNEGLFAALKQRIETKSINKNKNDHDLPSSRLKNPLYSVKKIKHIISHRNIRYAIKHFLFQSEISLFKLHYPFLCFVFRSMLILFKILIWYC